MTIDPKILGVIIVLIGILEAVKKLAEKTIGQWILKKIFKWDEIPSWFNTILVNVIAILYALKGFLADGVFTWDEFWQLLEIILGANGLFMMYRSIKETMKKENVG